MELDPAECWENNAETWTRQSRAGYDVYRDLVNTPAFLAMLPPVDGMSGLDVGCGEGTNTRQVAARGAAMQGVDIAPTFIRYAAAAEAEQPLGIRYRVGDAAALPFADAEFDFATAFMSLMDVTDPAAVLAEIARVLKPGGFLQFSILHPCFAPPHRRVVRDDSGKTLAIEVADYFATGRHSESWYFGATSEEEKKTVQPFTVPYAHLTLSQWLAAIRAAGMALEELGEPSASDDAIRKDQAVEDTRVAPLFLHFRTRKG